VRDEDLPDYRKMFNDLFHQQGFEYNNVFDWTIRESKRPEPDGQEPLTSKDVDERRRADTTKPSGCGVQVVIKATRRKRRWYSTVFSNMGMEMTIDTPMTTITPFGCIGNAGGQILGSVPLAKLEGGCYRSLRPNHFAGSNTDREAGSVESKSFKP
jgi:hypothetical protein